MADEVLKLIEEAYRKVFEEDTNINEAEVHVSAVNVTSVGFLAAVSEKEDTTLNTNQKDKKHSDRGAEEIEDEVFEPTHNSIEEGTDRAKIGDREKNESVSNTSSETENAVRRCC